MDENSHFTGQRLYSPRDKNIALHHWERVGQGAENYQTVLNRINQARSIYEVNKVLLGSSDNFANDGVSPQYDPMYELQLMK